MVVHVPETTRLIHSGSNRVESCRWKILLFLSFLKKNQPVCGMMVA